MNQLFSLFTLLLMGQLLYAQQGTRPSCHYSEYVEMLQKEYPALEESMQELDRSVAAWNKKHHEKSATLFTIPVVVHVIYRTAEQNIPDEQIRSQIKVLNEDFSRLNPDQLKTPGPFLGVAANCQIRFCLAQLDPNGQPTTGITRTMTTVEKIGYLGGSEYHSTAQGGHDSWDRDSYLNIWVCEMDDQVLGFASPPSLGTPEERDGVVIGYQYFGNQGNVVSPNDKGRTTTHEIGHWLGLDHLWGKGSVGSCTNDDGISDTPNQEEANYYCPKFPSMSCSGEANGDMFMNYMDYVDDNCMNIFTQGQKARMHAVMNSLPRLNLASSAAGCSYTGIDSRAERLNDLKLFPNPSKGSITLQLPENSGNWSVSIYNVPGSLVFHREMLFTGGTATLDLPLRRGIYSVVLNSGEKQLYKKLVIEN